MAVVTIIDRMIDKVVLRESTIRRSKKTTEVGSLVREEELKIIINLVDSTTPTTRPDT